MNLPKIIFRRSWVYDIALVRDSNYEESNEKVVQKNFLRIQKEWGLLGNKIVKAISEVTKLPWNEKEIVVYVTYGVFPYSDPLTINDKSSIHTLTHELIHRILSEEENWLKIKSNWRLLMNKYRNEDKDCKTHIIIHAIHLEILKQFFDEKTIEKEIHLIENKNYIRSWDIVIREGHQTIIKKLTQKNK